MRHRGINLTGRQKEDVFTFLELGKLINNHHDGVGPLPVDKYKKLRRGLRKTPLKPDYLQYYKDVAVLEHNRPNPWKTDKDLLNKVAQYRSGTNLVYWAAACSAAGIASYSELVNHNFDFTDSAPDWFKGMHSLLLALQVTDDKIGWKGDLRFQRPSFFTAFCPGEYLKLPPEYLPPIVIQTVFFEMDKHFAVYLKQAQNKLPGHYALLAATTALNQVPNLARWKLYEKMQELTGIELVNSRHFAE